jgi:hypothetical protein
MVLSGTIYEYILADVFQLLAQQKVTGVLELKDGENTALAVFENGMLVGARDGKESIERKIAFYLINEKEKNQKSILGLLTSYEGNPRGFINEVVTRRFIEHDECVKFVRLTLEDTACGLFIWCSGSYNFSSATDITPYRIESIALPPDMVIMEAMRRIDEWKRMGEFLTDESIYVVAEKSLSLSKNDVEQAGIKIEHIREVAGKLNGTSTVELIAHNSYIAKYRVYEILFMLLQNDKITPLSPKLAESIKAALEKQHGFHFPFTSQPVTQFSVITLILCIAYISLFSLHFTISSRMRKQAYTREGAMREYRAERKVQMASTHFHANEGHVSPYPAILVQRGYLHKKDILPLKNKE